MNLIIKNNHTSYKKSIYIKKFFLIYLLKIREEKVSIIGLKKKFFSTSQKNFLKKDDEISIFQYTKCFGEDFFKFYFIFQILVGFFSETKKFTEFNKKFLPKIKLKKFNNQSRNKKYIYLVENFQKSKERQYLWFHETRKNSFFRKPQKNQKAYNIFNSKILLNVISAELSKQSIIGFSKKSIEFINELLTKTIQDILMELGEISNKRKTSKKKILDEWGKNNLIQKKIKNYPKFHFELKFKIKLMISIRKFKAKKKLFENLENKNKNNATIKNLVNTKNDEKKFTETDDILFRANTTLMTLLRRQVG